MAIQFERIISVSAGIPTGGGYGSATGDPTSTNAIHCFRNTTPVAVDTNLVDLQELRDTFTKTNGDLSGRQLLKFTPGFVVQSFASNAGTFRFDPIFRMCGMQKVSSSSSSLTYQFKTFYAVNGATTGYNDGIVNVYMNDASSDSVKWRMLGTQGTFTMSGSAGQPITMDATLSGLYAAPSLVGASVTATLPGINAEIMQTEAMTIGGSTYKFKSFSLDAGLEVQEDTDANASKGLAALVITNRKPTLQMVIGADSTNYVSFYADLTAQTERTITFLHGSAAGKFMRLVATGRLTNVTMSADVGIRTFTLDYQLTNSTGDNELKLEFS
jgi:hypothetical protein